MRPCTGRVPAVIQGKGVMRLKLILNSSPPVKIAMAGNLIINHLHNFDFYLMILYSTERSLICLSMSISAMNARMILKNLSPDQQPRYHVRNAVQKTSQKSFPFTA